MNTKKSHTSSELTIIRVIYLGVESHITSLCVSREQELHPTACTEWGCMLYAGIYSIVGHTQVGWNLKCCWLNEFQQHLPLLFK